MQRSIKYQKTHLSPESINESTHFGVNSSIHDDVRLIQSCGTLRLHFRLYGNNVPRGDQQILTTISAIIGNVRGVESGS